MPKIEEIPVVVSKSVELYRVEVRDIKTDWYETVAEAAVDMSHKLVHRCNLSESYIESLKRKIEELEERLKNQPGKE